MPGAVVDAEGVLRVARHADAVAPAGAGRPPPDGRPHGHPATQARRPARRRKHDHTAARAGAPEATRPPTPPPAGETRAVGRRPLLRQELGEAIRENTVTVTVLALVGAVVLGGLLTAFTNSSVLHAWGDFFSAPGNAIAKAWDAAAGTYVALFEGSVFNPHAVAALFQQASLSTASTTATCRRVLPAVRDRGPGDPADPGRARGSAAVPGGPLQHRRAEPVHRRRDHGPWLGYAVSLPFFVHVAVCVIGGFVGGAALGWLAGEIKARTGAHEVIVTIMLNYVMQYFLAYLLSSQSLMQAPGTSNTIASPIASDARLPLLPAPTCASTPAS